MLLDQKGMETAWPDLMRDLKRLQAVHMNLDGCSCRFRPDFEGVAYRALKATGVQPPIEIVSNVIMRHEHLSTSQRYLGKVTDVVAMRWIKNLYG